MTIKEQKELLITTALPNTGTVVLGTNEDVPLCGRCKKHKGDTDGCCTCFNTNPNGANQYRLDPRQKLCWELYINPKSETFGNAKQSALKVGYEENYANTITVTTWFLDKVRRLNMLSKAEKVLDETLEMPTKIQEVQGYGEDKELVVVTEPALVKIKQDTAKFIAERLGKNEGYSPRSELTGADGKDLVYFDLKDKTNGDTLTHAFLTSRTNTGDSN